MKRWLAYRYLRLLVVLKRNSIGVLRRLESGKVDEMDQIQQLVYNITLELIHDPNAELRSNNIDYTQQVENDKYLIIIRPQSGHYSISLFEYIDRTQANNFDVPFDIEHIKLLIEKFDREVHKRMKSRQLLKTTKVAKHLRQILIEIEQTKTPQNKDGKETQ